MLTGLLRLAGHPKLTIPCAVLEDRRAEGSVRVNQFVVRMVGRSGDGIHQYKSAAEASAYYLCVCFVPLPYYMPVSSKTVP